MVHINMTDAICVSHDGDSRMILNISDQFITASWDNQIDELIER